LPSAKPFASDVSSPSIPQISEAAQNITFPYYLHFHSINEPEVVTVALRYDTALGRKKKYLTN